MKRFTGKVCQFALLTVFCMASVHASASSYLTIAENDTLRISPNLLGSTVTVRVIGNFDNGVADHFRLEITHPYLMSLSEYNYGYGPTASLFGMQIPYIQSDGTDTVYNATLNVIQDEEIIDLYTRRSIVESSTTVFGYWDYDNNGTYDPYGMIKWGPGRYDRMFEMNFVVYADCTGDTIVFDGLMTSTYDWRYPTQLINTMFHQEILIRVAYMLGDVNGDEVLNVDDVTALIGYLNGNPEWTQYQLDAADVDQNGQISIGDVTALINMLLS